MRRGGAAIAGVGVAALVVGGWLCTECSVETPCCGACPESLPASFELSCDSTGLQAVAATGPCAKPDASLSSYMGNRAVFVESDDAGACAIELTFVSGFRYSADVTFAWKSGGVCGGPQCKCADYLAPTSGPFAVNNPSATCVDAGADADANADAGPDR
jgi:hypothetical protein